MARDTTTTDTLTIAPLEAVAHFRACQEIQRRAWGIVEDGYLIPVATMISVQHAGGLVLGAFAGEDLIGFSFAYLGRVGGRWVLYSQLTGVDPAAQSGGVGRALKQAQWDWAQAEGLAAIVWTFDPLQAANANFNLHHLGAYCRAYHINYFGPRTDALNRGGDTDRLLAEWPVHEPPLRWPAPDDAPPLDLIERDAAGAAVGVRPLTAATTVRIGVTDLTPPPPFPTTGKGEDDRAPRRGTAVTLSVQSTLEADQITSPPDHTELNQTAPFPLGKGAGGLGQPPVAPSSDQAEHNHDAPFPVGKEAGGLGQPLVRAAFQSAFAAGYVAHDFERDRAAGLGHYILRRPLGG